MICFSSCGSHNSLPATEQHPNSLTESWSLRDCSYVMTPWVKVCAAPRPWSVPSFDFSVALWPFNTLYSEILAACTELQ